MINKKRKFISMIGTSPFPIRQWKRPAQGRGFTGAFGARISKALKKRRPRLFRPGYDRTGGFYGKPEVKFLDTSISGQIDSTGEIAPGNGTSTSLCLIPQGDTESTRDGRECVVTSIQVRGKIFSPAPPTAAAIIKMWIILDTQANGQYPSYSDVFTGTTYNEFRNLSNNKRFKILKEYCEVLDGRPDGTLGFGITLVVDEYLKCNIPLTFSSTTGAITELKQNNIFIMWASDQDDYGWATLKCRIRFTG